MFCSCNQVQREDLECQEGDRIISVDGLAVSTIDDLRIAIMGKEEVSLKRLRNPPCTRSTRAWSMQSARCMVHLSRDFFDRPSWNVSMSRDLSEPSCHEAAQEFGKPARNFELVCICIFVHTHTRTFTLNQACFRLFITFIRSSPKIKFFIAFFYNEEKTGSCKRSLYSIYVPLAYQATALFFMFFLIVQTLNLIVFHETSCLQDRFLNEKKSVLRIMFLKHQPSIMFRSHQSSHPCSTRILLKLAHAYILLSVKHMHEYICITVHNRERSLHTKETYRKRCRHTCVHR